MQLVQIDLRPTTWREGIEGGPLPCDIHPRVSLKVHLRDVHQHVDVSEIGQSVDNRKIKSAKVVWVKKREVQSIGWSDGAQCKCCRRCVAVQFDYWRTEPTQTLTRQGSPFHICIGDVYGRERHPAADALIPRRDTTPFYEFARPPNLRPSRSTKQIDVGSPASIRSGPFSPYRTRNVDVSPQRRELVFRPCADFFDR